MYLISFLRHLHFSNVILSWKWLFNGCPIKDLRKKRVWGKSISDRQIFAKKLWFYKNPISRFNYIYVYQINSFKGVKNDLTFAPSLFFFHIIISSPNISFVFFGLFFTTAFQEIAIPSNSRKPLSILRVLDFELSTKYKADTLYKRYTFAIKMPS